MHAYIHTSHAMLSSGIPWNMSRVTCIRRKYKWQVACSTVSHAKALHNMSENFGNALNPFWGSLKNLWNFWKTSETVQKCFPVVYLFKIFEKCSEIFGSVQKYLEIFGKLRKRFKSNFQMFYDFFKLLENLRKSSEIFGKFLDVVGNVRNGSQELKSLRSPQVDPS